METNMNMNGKQLINKVCMMAVISLLLSIPLIMIEDLIHEREATKDSVAREIARSVAQAQVVGGLALETDVRTSKDSTVVQKRRVSPMKLDYKADVATETLHRSIYDVIVYKADIEISGSFVADETCIDARRNRLSLRVTDVKGLTDLPQVAFGSKTSDFTLTEDRSMQAQVELPEDIKAGDEMDFRLALKLKGTDSLMFSPEGARNTLTVSSSYPHPSFQGSFLPDSREVRKDGFDAVWKVLDINVANPDKETIGVKFVDPANPYQQATRSAKYALLIIVLVFVSGLFVEYFTRKDINLVQYAVIGLSLMLFYALLLSFSEFVPFGLAYLVAAVMTVLALLSYFRWILKGRCAYLLGGIIALAYLVNYVLLQMETYALLAGSLVLFVLLWVVMYLTANISDERE